ncbi:MULTISPECIES: hypothetical protein [Streptomyces]|uniref:Uncharacterized protein n=1 Tax=Streptomyces doudnae TaxID=3075536 RepID=A0ABD5EN38_9ACTN|nr:MULTISPECIES: hypothetical protein [unclassified Streptomyces]MDT0435672.1 hypothetical protein [Streptomyces sp. DSM 41981]MYQ62626.1 hypothetical protein [Streptomyces sp. SID4950]SCD41013.1 hypothetical protein GA0115242_1048132 [Streptomyces sp. SolWspMP-5a-2]
MPDRITQPHLILAALDEATRYPDKPAHRNQVRSDGGGEARTVARNLMSDCHQDDHRPVDVVTSMDRALRVWLQRGPTTSLGEPDYEIGYALVQKTIRRLLDGDPKTIQRLLEAARYRAVRFHDEAAQR